jgi:hypothetical protein
MQALGQLEPGLDVIRVGDPGAPPQNIQDPALLIAAEAMGRVLVSRDRSTMPVHLTDHFVSGHHTAGVILLRNGFTIGQYAQSVVNQWATTAVDEWVDRTIYLP